ncbi:MAG: hypothetical protein AAFN11_15475 [Chloroflexota bacterium]
MQRWIWMCLFILCACGGTGEDIIEIDYEGDLVAYATEASQIREDIVISRTDIASTVEAGNAQTSQFERYNDLLRSTVVVAIPPTSDARIVANDTIGALPVEVYDLSDGEMRFVQIGPAGEINDENCFIAKQQFFRTDSVAVFMTAVALNLRAGTTVSAEWRYGGELVYSNSWVAPQSVPYQCVSLTMRPSDAEFATGNWTVTLFVNGNPDEPKSFTIFSN